MALEYVVTKRVFGFDKDKNEKYVAKSVRSGRVSFSKMCGKVSRLCGVHRKVVDLVVSGLVDMMAEDIDDGKSVQMGEFGIFSPTIRAKSADDEKEVSSKSIAHKPAQLARVAAWHHQIMLIMDAGHIHQMMRHAGRNQKEIAGRRCVEHSVDFQ